MTRLADDMLAAWNKQIDALTESLDDTLADTDALHKDELLSIIELAKQRLKTYVSEYGIKQS